MICIQEVAGSIPVSSTRLEKKVKKIKKICKSVIEWFKPLGMTEDMYEEELLYRDAKEDWQKMNKELQHADDR